MDVQFESDGKKGAFFIEEEGKRIGEMSIVFAGDTRFIIDHTVVDPKSEGKGIGKQLLKAAVEFARKHHYKITPLCPFAKAVFDRTTEYNDVLF